MSRHDRLGRGLGALLGEYAAGDSPRTSDEAASPPKIPLRAIARNPHQPRRDFPTDELSELAASIEANGLLQPIVVRRGKAGAAYELVAGGASAQGGQRARVDGDPSLRTGCGRSRAPRSGARREYPARGPRAAGGGKGVRRASEGLWIAAAGNRRSGRKEPPRSRELPSHSGAAVVCQAASGGGNDLHGARTGAALRRGPDQGGRARSRSSGRRLVGEGDRESGARESAGRER